MRRVIIVIALAFVAASSQGQELRVYFGNLHSHTGYSDGSATPHEAYQYARDVAGLDFLAITEHNHAKQIKPKDRQGDPIGKDHTLYNGDRPDSLIRQAALFTENDRFVALYGQEFSTISSGNHSNVFEIGEVITAESGQYDQLVKDWLPAHLDSMSQPAILQFNHPSSTLRPKEYGRDDFGDDDTWLKLVGKHARLIEILNGPGLKKLDGQEPEEFESHFKYYLNLGFHLAPTGDQDNHYRTWGTLTEARTGIITTSLTKENLLRAMRARHVYATEDKNLRFIPSLTFASLPPGREFFLFGDIIESPPPIGTILTIHYSLQDDDEPNAEYQIEVLTDTIGEQDTATVLQEQTQIGNTPPNVLGMIRDIEYTGGGQYFYLRVNQTDEDGQNNRLWTAPIWFGPATTEIEPLPGDLPSQFVASRRSKIYHTDPNCRDARSISPGNLLRGDAATQGRTPHQGCPR